MTGDPAGTGLPQVVRSSYCFCHPCDFCLMSFIFRNYSLLMFDEYGHLKSPTPDFFWWLLLTLSHVLCFPRALLRRVDTIFTISFI